MDRALRCIGVLTAIVIALAIAVGIALRQPRALTVRSQGIVLSSPGIVAWASRQFSTSLASRPTRAIRIPVRIFAPYWAGFGLFRDGCGGFVDALNVRGLVGVSTFSALPPRRFDNGSFPPGTTLYSEHLREKHFKPASSLCENSA